MDTLTNNLKKYFTQSHFTSVSEIVKERRYEDVYNDDVRSAFMLSHLLISIIMISIIIAGFMAVPHLCNDNSERGKNTRLGLYVLLLLSGGQIGWLYIILWIAKINICA